MTKAYDLQNIRFCTRDLSHNDFNLALAKLESKGYEKEYTQCRWDYLWAFKNGDLRYSDGALEYDSSTFDAISLSPNPERHIDNIFKEFEKSPENPLEEDGVSKPPVLQNIQFNISGFTSIEINKLFDHLETIGYQPWSTSCNWAYLCVKEDGEVDLSDARFDNSKYRNIQLHPDSAIDAIEVIFNGDEEKAEEKEIDSKEYGRLPRLRFDMVDCSEEMYRDLCGILHLQGYDTYWEEWNHQHYRWVWALSDGTVRFSVNHQTQGLNPMFFIAHRYRQSGHTTAAQSRDFTQMRFDNTEKSDTMSDIMNFELGTSGITTLKFNQKTKLNLGEGKMNDLINKVQETAVNLVADNKKAAKTAAIFKMGDAAITLVVDKVLAMLPEQYRGMADNALGHLVIINAVLVMIDSFDLKDPRIKTLKQALLTAQMGKGLDSLNIEGLAQGFLDGVMGADSIKALMEAASSTEEG